MSISPDPILLARRERRIIRPGIIAVYQPFTTYFRNSSKNSAVLPPMPHFFFHLHDGKSRVEDRRGVSLPDAEAAWYQAYRKARDLFGGDRCRARPWLGHSLEVEDEGGIHIWTVPLAEIVELVG